MADRLFLRLADDPLYAPETTVPLGTMQEFAVPAVLAPYVAHAMAYREHLPAGSIVTERVLPDGALRLIVDTSENPPSVRVVGARAQATVLTHQGDQQGLSLTLLPGASQALLGVAAHELAAGTFAWDDVAAAPARALAQRIGEASTPRARMGAMLAMLREGLRAPAPTEHMRIRAAMALLCGSLARRPVREASAVLGISERRMEQLFGEHVGLRPKEWHRLARFHACVRMLRRACVPTWAALAADAGFHDQAHLAHEFRAIAGLTPGQFAASRGVSDFSKTGA